MRNPVDITIPEGLVEKAAGVRLVTAKFMGAGRAAKIARAGARAAFDQMEDVGPRAQDMLDRHEAKQKAGDAKADPEKMALVRYPPLTVCEYLVTALDGTEVKREAVVGWLDDVHPDVARHVALTLIRLGDLIDETEADQGEDSGGSSGS